MNNRRRDLGDESRMPETVEAMLRAAANYVIPSEDLRPRVMDAAREHCAQRKIQRKLVGYMLSSLLICVLCWPLVDELAELRSQLASPSSAEMLKRSFEITHASDVGSNWGLAEAFSELRRAQANILHEMIHLGPSSIAPLVP